MAIHSICIIPVTNLNLCWYTGQGVFICQGGYLLSCCLCQSLDSLEHGDLSVMWWWGWVIVAQAVSMRAYIGSIVVIPKSTAFLDTSRRLRILFSGGIPGEVDLGWLLYLPLWMVWMTRIKLLWEHRKYLCFGLSSNWTGIRIDVNP